MEEHKSVLRSPLDGRADASDNFPGRLPPEKKVQKEDDDLAVVPGFSIGLTSSETEVVDLEAS